MQELYSLAAQRGWRMTWAVCARLWEPTEGHPELLGRREALSKGGILRRGLDGRTGVLEFSQGEAHSGSGDSTCEVSELGSGLVHPGTTGPAEELVCRTRASGGGGDSHLRHAAWLSPGLCVGAGAGSLPRVGLHEGSGNRKPL